MIDLTKLIRTDRGLAINETSIREEVTRIIDLERDIANVSWTLCIFPAMSVGQILCMFKILLFWSLKK